MSDHDTPDPIDKTYVEAETVLGDEVARAARRARLLAAVEQDAQTPMAAVAAAPPVAASVATPAVKAAWRPNWRRNSWLAAACVAALGVFFATRFFQPIEPARPVAHAPAHAANPAAPTTVATPPPVVAKAPPRLKAPEAPRVALHVTSPVMMSAPPVAPPPPAPVPAPALRGAPPATAGKAANEVNEVAVTGSRAPQAAKPRTEVTILGGANARDANGDRTFTFAYPPPPPPAPPPPPPEAGFVGAVDLSESLGAAAFAGRTSEVEALLSQGVPVDAADANGDTALMKSVRGDHPAVAALLLRHGAGLDRKNKAGKSARDMAAMVGDEALDRALGLVP